MKTSGTWLNGDSTDVGETSPNTASPFHSVFFPLRQMTSFHILIIIISYLLNDNEST